MMVCVMTHEHDVDRPAPGELWRVQRLVNTADFDLETDELTSGAQAGAWLRSVGLAGEGESFSDEDAARLVLFREALRGLLLAHNGVALDAGVVAELERVGRRATVAVGFDAAGAPVLAPAGAGIDGVLGRLLAIVARAEAEGTWERLKACPADACEWAFYDFSRNHSRTWCDMKVCGNRAKARTYRSRAGTPRPPR
jgi:predicted RNA-binding Zn ribbon-like protein